MLFYLLFVVDVIVTFTSVFSMAESCIHLVVTFSTSCILGCGTGITKDNVVRLHVQERKCSDQIGKPVP